MPIYPYEYTHDDGSGNGSIEAKDPTDAKKLVTESVRLMESDDRKITHLNIKIGEALPEEE